MESEASADGCLCIDSGAFHFFPSPYPWPLAIAASSSGSKYTNELLEFQLCDLHCSVLIVKRAQIHTPLSSGDLSFDST